ncbi:MAG: hypothetical protein QF792_06730 [Phycisphaerae bacterium]|nr:hypothetical protein [Phycisphaerae bacterium]
MNKVDDKSIQGPNSPLTPMPGAPGEITAAWLDRMKQGAFLYLATFCCAFVLKMFLPRVTGARRVAVSISYSLLGLVYIVTVWLITLPEPGNPRWLRRLRWIVRASLVAVFAHEVIYRMGLHVFREHLETLAPSVTILQLVSGMGSAAFFWYVSVVCGRLGDQGLKAWFKALA